jgi:hypothetical protein
MIKNNILVLIVLLVGILTLFFFPSPASNLTAYFGAMLFFGMLIFLLIRTEKTKTKKQKKDSN